MQFETLIDVVSLTGRLSDPALVVLDCRYDLFDPAAGRRAFAAGHLPGAHYVDLAEDLSGPVTATSGRHPLPDAAGLAARLGALGVGPGRQVVCYDEASGVFAARAWWLLRWLGHAGVAVLDGGFAAWQAAGLPIVTDCTRCAGVQQWAPGPALVDAIQADALAQVPGTRRRLLVDARSAERFRGENEPVDPVAGHIPGAINRPFTDNLADGHFKPAGLLAAEWHALLGGRAVNDLVVYCGSGVSACHHLLALAHAGLPGARLYPGSWSEWCRDPARPVARGA